MDAMRKYQLLQKTVAYLIGEREALGNGPRASRPHEGIGVGDLWTLFRALVNTREPVQADESFYRDQDELLQGLIAEAGVSGPADATPAPLLPHASLWRGDITTFAADAVVNAANSQMLGCWVPGHNCIDNAIHTFAGVQLREECARIMAAQGHEEPTGQAKVTDAYNLPAKHVIHTVGPVANGHPGKEHREQLASSYESCLAAAADVGCKSIAFCCISTGIFGFPQEEAADIAVHTVRTWLAEHAGAHLEVVFNVFGEVDEGIYKDLLGIR